MIFLRVHSVPLFCAVALLTAAAAQGQTPYFGIGHNALGGATLGGPESHDQLIVSNIGSSGDDGVEMTAGLSEGLVVAIDPATCPLTFPDGSSMQFSVLPAAEGFVTYIINIDVSGGQWRSTVLNFGNPALDMDVFVYDDNQLVGISSAAVFATEAANWTADACLEAIDWIQYDDGPGFGVVLQAAATFNLADGQQLVGDEIRFLPNSQPDFNIATYALRAANINPVVIENELLQKFGNLHHAEGDAQMFPTANHLPLTTLGFSGNDGVTMEILDSFFQVFTQAFADPDPTGSLIEGARMIVQGRGLVSGNPDAALGTMVLTKTASGITTAVDTSPIGAASATAEFYNGGDLVATAGGLTGVFLQTSDWPSYMGYESSGYPAEPPGFIQGYPAPVAFTVLSVRGVILADTVKILAEGGSAVSGLAQYTLRVAGIPQLVIVREKGTDLTDVDIDGVADVLDNCILAANNNQIDTNGDGIGNLCDGDVIGNGGGPEDCFVNFADLNLLKAAFFSNSTQPNYDPDLDFNSDGGINFPDLDLMRDFFFFPPGPSASGCN